MHTLFHRAHQLEAIQWLLAHDDQANLGALGKKPQGGVR